MMRNCKLLVALFVVPALVIILVPWSTTVVLPVRVQVFDETGKPAAGVRVEQEWQFFASDADFERAISATDADGYVTLPKRTVRISLASRAVGYGRSLLPLMCGYEYGPFGSITAYAPDRHSCDTIVYDIRHPNLRQLTLTHWEFCSTAGRT